MSRPRFRSSRAQPSLKGVGRLLTSLASQGLEKRVTKDGSLGSVQLRGDASSRARSQFVTMSLGFDPVRDAN